MVSCCASNCIRQCKSVVVGGKSLINTAGFSVERTCRYKDVGECPYSGRVYRSRGNTDRK